MSVESRQRRAAARAARPFRAKVADRLLPAIALMMAYGHPDLLGQLIHHK